MSNKSLILGGIFLLVLVFGVVFFTLTGVGGSYNDRINSLIQKPPDPPQTRDKKIIRKVTIKKDDEESCLEVTPDGIVRSYAECGGDLTDATRLSNPKNLLKLIDIAAIIDTSKFREKPKGPSMTIIIETDTGTEIIYVPVDSGGGDDSIDHIIDQIIGDLPQPTQTPGPTTIPTPTLPGTTIVPTITPTPTSLPGIYPTPTPEPSAGPKPFLCGFQQDQTGKKPYTISNYICSTEPSPAP